MIPVPDNVAHFPKPAQLNDSFQYPLTTNIQTLSTKNVERGNDPYGILYVPDLQSDDCKNSEAQYIAKNATRLRNLPQGANYALVAFAPWYSPTCMHEYFSSARKAPTKALVVYQPGTSAAMPPPMSDASWGLGDGGSWKSSNNFPTYAIMSASGGIIAQQLSLYSGNLTDVPYGHDLSAIFSPTDYVRLWATVSTQAGSQLPSLWVFLVIVLGLLILVVVVTSTLMHIIQRRRRNDLRNRIVNGDVNLEALGVKRLTVPRDYLNKLPHYVYSASANERDLEKDLLQAPAQTHSKLSVAKEGLKTGTLSRRSSAPTMPTVSAFSQPTCPICLEDFESNKSMVRELPCRHIFHPDCIDTFLLSNSSLCPVCKTSVLPTGYCPAQITNIMVRRERMIRRMRARNGGPRDSLNARRITVQYGATRAVGSFGSRIGGAITGRRVFSAPERQTRPPDIEMAPPPSPPELVSISEAPPPSVAPLPPSETPQSPPQNRGEWAREGPLTLLGNHHVPAHDDDETGPRWKRGLRKVFPGFR